MTVHINGSKGKELYYNGVKIKEAYYNGNKVYSSGPLYYCYRSDIFGTYYYFYIKEKPTTPSSITTYSEENNTHPASSSADLVRTETLVISSVTESSFVLDGGFVCDYYPSGDLYT